MTSAWTNFSSQSTTYVRLKLN